MLDQVLQTQATELGVAPRTSRQRPKVISSVASVKDCDKWRGDVMRDISRKVTRIQDSTLIFLCKLI